ncbi:hypothetical protein [Mycolicibacterium sp. S3B2]|uniref:hypothetical protein n=1 Tax=Mycolicibacterium sp. S3B2 TaxID=3415120 RepID=UPI003C79EEFC
MFYSIGTAALGIFNWVRDIAMNTFNWIKSINWGQVLIAVGRGLANSIIGLIEGAINGAFEGIPGSPKVSLPRFARGTNFAPGGLALVGEEGPELVNLPRGSKVKMAGETRQAMSQARSGVKIDVTQHIHNQVDYDKAWKQIGFKLRVT